MRRYWVMTLAAAMVMAGCNGGSGSGTPAADNGSSTTPGAAKLTIEVIPKGATHDYWKSLHEGVNKARDEFGLDIVWKSSEKEDDRNGQISIVQDAIQKKVDGIVLAPLDATALKGPVVEAQNAKIPVVIIDSGVNDVKPVSFVATDNEKGGHIAGAALAKLLNGKGSVVMLRYEVGSASTDAREKGFMDEMAKNPGIKVVSSNQYGHATVETAQTASENLLSGFKKADGSLTIDGIYTPNESTTFGMLRVLQDSGQAGKVKFVGFDANPKLIEALGNHQIDALVVQDPRKMGYLGVKAIVDEIHGKPVDARIDTGATLVTPANMKDTEIAALIAPPKE
jgi:ribose transport system substrate-binding protein